MKKIYLILAIFALLISSCGDVIYPEYSRTEILKEYAVDSEVTYDTVLAEVLNHKKYVVFMMIQVKVLIVG